MAGADLQGSTNTYAFIPTPPYSNTLFPANCVLQSAKIEFLPVTIKLPPELVTQVVAFRNVNWEPRNRIPAKSCAFAFILECFVRL